MKSTFKSKITIANASAADVFDGIDGQLMILSAFRYCLGRQIYFVSACVDWFRHWWPYVSAETAQTIVRDIVEALMDDDLSRIDKPAWQELAEFAFSRLPLEKQTWCKDSVLYKNKPWPLREIDDCTGNSHE